MVNEERYLDRRARISCTPGVCGGEPCIAGTRITTRFVWDAVKAGRGQEYLFWEYRLAAYQVKAAVAYESRLHRRIGRLIEAKQRELCRKWGYCDE